MLPTPFSSPAPAAFVIETPVDQILDFFGGILVPRAIDGPRIDSESRCDLSEISPFSTDRDRFFEGRGTLKDFVIGEGAGGDVGRLYFVGIGIRGRWGMDSLELEEEGLWPVT